jgi:hypothetical protein
MRSCSADRTGQRVVSDGERLRVWTMNVLRFGFVFGTGLADVLSPLLHSDDSDPTELVESWRGSLSARTAH